MIPDWNWSHKAAWRPMRSQHGLVQLPGEEESALQGLFLKPADPGRDQPGGLPRDSCERPKGDLKVISRYGPLLPTQHLRMKNRKKPNHYQSPKLQPIRFCWGNAGGG